MMSTTFARLPEILVVVTEFEGEYIDWQGDGFYIRRFRSRYVYDWVPVADLDDLIDAEVNCNRYQYVTSDDVSEVYG